MAFCEFCGGESSAESLNYEGKCIVCRGGVVRSEEEIPYQTESEEPTMPAESAWHLLRPTAMRRLHLMHNYDTQYQVDELEKWQLAVRTLDELFGDGGGEL